MGKFFAAFLLFASVLGFAQQRIEVFFGFDRYDLKPAELQKLDIWLASNPDAQISAIYGYCDHLGSLSYNDSLSVRRALAVKDYLGNRNAVFSESFEVKGYGENFTQSGDRARNRKVTVVYGNGKLQPKEKSELQKKVEQSVVGEKIRLPNLNFFNMSEQIVPKSKPLLDDLLRILRDNPELKIQIQGHICCQTVRERDYSYVSTMRAKAVYDFLVRNGIGADRLSYKGFGVSRPLHPIPEKNEQERDDNRRVEIEILSN